MNATPDTACLRVDYEGPTVILTMARPQRRNALSLPLMQELIAALRGLDDSVRAVILAAEGPAFSSGHDLKELTGHPVDQCRIVFDASTELMNLIESIPQPVIAEVQGVATAAGCQLVATCDLAVAADHALFSTPGVKIGLFCTTPMVALTRCIGRKHAMEMLLTGQEIQAHQALEWGLVNKVVPTKFLRATTMTFAEQIASASRFTVTLGKQAFYAQIDLDQQKAYAYAKEVMTMNAACADAQEGMAAFLDKREARWQE